MPEFRKDIINDEWVIISTERAGRPESFREKKIRIPKKSTHICPFDHGNENMSPPEILRMDPKGNIIDKKNKNWQFRIVPNKYPALFPSAEAQSRNYGVYILMEGFGFHEVVIHSPRHITSMNDLTVGQLKNLIRLYIRRLRDIRKDRRIESIIVMVNQGREAGASLEHSHSQIFALPLIPPVIHRELLGTKRYFNRHQKCPVCDLLKFEKAEDKRIVFENECFYVIQPYASRSPFETWIAPKDHNPNFEDISDQEIECFSQCLKKVLEFFYNEMNDPPFNYYIHSGPVNTRSSFKFYHWNFELIPKTKVKAGFELAAGIDINITSPEYTAEFMKDSKYFN